MLLKSDEPIGFSWGYQMPEIRTQSVNFPVIRELFRERGINPDKVFYGAETGIVAEYQKRGLGSVIASVRCLEAQNGNYDFFANRTINPRMKAISSHIFSGSQATELFEDPETKSPWFMWRFKDFDREYARKKLGRLR